MVREFTILRALFPSVVPVPEPLALCEDRSVTGSVFYAMRTVVGSSLYSAEESSALVPLEMRRDHGFHFIEVLADLHGIDPSAVGLGDLGRPDAYVARQLKRWKASWDASATTVLPDVGRLHEFLANNTPEQGPARVVHGDYGLHNCVSTAQGRIAAVIDWEISTLGDPLADLAYAINAWGEAGEESSRGVKPSLAPGYPTGNELLARYCARTRTEVSDIGFYRAFNHWKTACIIDGVLARYFNGQKSTEGVDLNALSAGRDEALARAVQAAIHLGYETT